MKKTLNFNDAIDELYKRIANINYDDLVYEIAHDIVSKNIKEIENSVDDVVDDDGNTLINDEFGEMWYDEEYDHLVEHIKDGMYQALKDE